MGDFSVLHCVFLGLFSYTTRSYVRIDFRFFSSLLRIQLLISMGR